MYSEDFLRQSVEVLLFYSQEAKSENRKGGILGGQKRIFPLCQRKRG